MEDPGCTDPIGKLMDELREKPKRFRATGGYERLLDVLRDGHAPDAVKQFLSEGTDVAGDLLWTIAELETVEPFVPEARQYLSSPDKGTAAYAMEIVLRAGHEADDLRAALDQLRACDVAVCEHAVRTLAGEGLGRLIEVLDGAGCTWSGQLTDKFSGAASRQEIERLIFDASRDRQVVGLVLATLAWEQDRTFADALARSDEPWIRDYGEWLEESAT
jgi:hypothetical protein